MIVLFMVMSFIIACVDWMCQSFLFLLYFFYFSTIVLGFVVVNCLPFLA